MSKPSFPTTQLFDIDFYNHSKSQLFETLHHHLEHDRDLWTILTPNPEQIIQAQTTPILHRAFNQATMNIPDGVGVVWASRVLGLHPEIEQRISGREVVETVLSWVDELQLKVLVIGGRELVSSSKYPVVSIHDHFETNLKSAKRGIYWLEGYQDVQNPTDFEEEKVVETIQSLHPDVVFVAFGAPYQEKWLLEHRQLLDTSKVKIAMVVGGAFDYLLGKVPPVPGFLARLGLEWLFRLITQPWRWRRQLRLIKFVKLVVQTKLQPQTYLGRGK